MTEPDPRQTLFAMAEMLTPWAIRVAATLRVADLIADGVTDPPSLAERTGTQPQAMHSLLHYLAGRGVFTVADGRFGLTPVGDLLRDGPQRRDLDIGSAGAHMDLAWAGLPHAVRTGTAGYGTVFGRPFWDDLDADPDLAASFDAFLGDWAATWVPAAVRAWPAELGGHVVDVAGGIGRLLGALLDADPTRRGTLVEQAASAARAREFLAGRNAEIVEGSFFDALPAGGDVYVLAQVVHDWPDEEAVTILRRCAEAAGAAGHVVLVERLVDPDAPLLGHSAMDLRMLVLFGSAERTRAQYADLAARAELRVVEDRPVEFGLSLLVLASADGHAED